MVRPSLIKSRKINK